jgi:hypothetical protein
MFSSLFMIFSSTRFRISPKSLSQGDPHEVYIGLVLMALIALSLCLTLVLPSPFYLQPSILPLVAGILYTSFLLQDIMAHDISENGNI